MNPEKNSWCSAAPKEQKPKFVIACDRSNESYFAFNYDDARKLAVELSSQYRTNYFIAEIKYHGKALHRTTYSDTHLGKKCYSYRKECKICCHSGRILPDCPKMEWRRHGWNQILEFQNIRILECQNIKIRNPISWV